jgi:CDP-diacylglycerol--serine O-phosphatidyltransferase
MKQLTRYIPHLLTAGNLMCGVGAIFLLSASDTAGESWHTAVYLIFAAWGCDILDGPLARKMGASGEFGKHFDMVADMVSFAVAPALLAWKFLFASVAAWAFLPAALFVLCGALRLSRFAILSRDQSHAGYFTGLPLPAAAALVCGDALLALPLMASSTIQIIQIPLVLLLSALMISPIKFPTFRHPIFVQSSAFFRWLALAATLFAVFYDIRLLIILFIAYFVVGIAITFRRSAT